MLACSGCLVAVHVAVPLAQDVYKEHLDFAVGEKDREGKKKQVLTGTCHHEWYADNNHAYSPCFKRQVGFLSHLTGKVVVQLQVANTSCNYLTIFYKYAMG